MRLRNISGARDAIAESPLVIHEPEKLKGKWRERFGNNRPIRIEIGMGKGKFIHELAEKNPKVNYIGIEKYSSVLLRALQKMEAFPVPNLLFLRMDAENITEVFDTGEVERIYLNFSDPWPKDRHAKRRLTSPEFMKIYDQVLKKDGVLEFKTDNKGLFAYSLESIPAAGWKISDFTYDLHHSPMADGNVMTEYETKFSSMGNSICKLIASR